MIETLNMRIMRAPSFFTVGPCLQGMILNKVQFLGAVIMMTAALVWSDTSNARIISDQVESITQNISLFAPLAIVRQTSDTAVAEITLRLAASSLVAIFPQHYSRNIPVKNFNQELWEGIFEMSHVPAVLTWSGNAQSEQGVLLTVSLKSINKKTGTISLLATVNEVSTTDRSYKFVYAKKPIIYGRLKNAFLVLDDQWGRIVQYDRSGVLDSRIASESGVSPGLMRPTLITSCVIGPFTNCPNAKLRGVDLSGANLCGANLSGADLSHSLLPRARLSYANLEGADLSYSELTDANLSHSSTTGANLNGTDVAGSGMAPTAGK